MNLPSVCPLDCPDSCSLTVTVEDGRATAVDGSRTNPYTEGYICAKVRKLPEHVYGAERLRHPMVRKGPKGAGVFERVGWDEALDLVARKLAETRDAHGGEAILPLCYGGSNGALSHGTLDERLWRRLGASELLPTLCAAPSGAAAQGLYGKMPGVALPDYVHARLIVLWGVNPNASGIHVIPRIQAARDQGAELIVVDPRRTPLAKQADLHLAPRPGTDLPLALALIRAVFEEGHADDAFLAEHTRNAEQLRAKAAPWTLAKAAEVCAVPEADLRSFVDRYVAASPAVIRCGWGQERNRNGGSATAAILALPAVAGKFGVRGGGFTSSNSRAIALHDAVRSEPSGARQVNMNQAGQVLCEADPPVKLAFAYDANPLATFPNQGAMRRGLLREDLFTVVFEQVMTDTARYADVLLPATTFLEHVELKRSYGAIALQRSEPVIAPVGEARSNLAVFTELLERLGLARPGEPATPDELIRALLGPGEEGDRLAADLRAEQIATTPTGFTPVPFVDHLPATPDRKVDLHPAALEAEALASGGALYVYRPDPGSQAFPLALISPATTRTISSSLGQLVQGKIPLAIHPDDAAARGIGDGAAVRIWNDLGELRCPAKLDPDQRPGVVCLPKGLWSHNTLDGNTANAVCPDSLSDLGGGACFNDARVQVERTA